MADRILIFIPTYNCARQIARVVEKIGNNVPPDIAMIMVVDNGSADGTREAACAALQNTAPCDWKVVRNRENYSLGGSHKVAFRYALENGFTHVVALHGDDQADFNDFAPLIARGAQRGTDALLGSRFIPGARLHGYSSFRRLGNLVFNFMFSISAGRRIHDMGSGLNIYGRKLLEDRDYDKCPNDLTFHCWFLLHMISRKRDLRFEPISWNQTDQESNAKLFRQARIILRLLLRYWAAPKRALQIEQGPARLDYTFVTVGEGKPR
jgi:glycosyltransferase involved in cell wall biosynthesis